MKPIKLPFIQAEHNSTVFINVDMSKGRWTKMRTISASGCKDVKNNLWYWVRSFFFK